MLQARPIFVQKQPKAFMLIFSMSRARFVTKFLLPKPQIYDNIGQICTRTRREKMAKSIIVVCHNVECLKAFFILIFINKYNYLSS